MTRQTANTREEVLGVLRRHDKPLSAYEILKRLRERNARLAPMTIYRALSGLTERGLAHRIESANAFVACRSQCRGEQVILSICDDCGTVAEHAAADVVRELSAITGIAGFSPSRHVIEVRGRCAACGAPEEKS